MAKFRRDHDCEGDGGAGRVPADGASQLAVDGPTRRYHHLARPKDAPDGRRDRVSTLDRWTDQVTAVLERFGDARGGPGATSRCQAQVVHRCWCASSIFVGIIRRCAGWRRRRVCKPRTTERPSTANPGRPVPTNPNPKPELSQYRVREFACQFNAGIWLYVHMHL
jgi:hypothetical protein